VADLSSTSLGRSREPSLDRRRPMDQGEAWQGIEGCEPCLTLSTTLYDNVWSSIDDHHVAPHCHTRLHRADDLG
jgi:hypothetical protein